MSLNKYVVLVENEESAWDDRTGVRYHFPKGRYLSRLEEGMQIIYYKGRTGNNSPQYFGYGQIGSIYPVSDDLKDYYADIINYIEFDQPVNFKLDGQYLEEVNVSNYFRQNSVRPISEDRFYQILKLAGLNILKDENNKVPPVVSLFPPLAEVHISLSSTPLIKQTITSKSKGQLKEPSPSYGSKNSKKHGDRGEFLVLKYLRSILSETEVDSMRHNAAEKEKDGYDISYTDLAGKRVYIEVKATSASAFQNFIITINELNAAETYGEAFKIYLVNRVTSKNASIEIIENIISLLEEGKFIKTPMSFKIQKVT